MTPRKSNPKKTKKRLMKSQQKTKTNPQSKNLKPLKKKINQR